MKSTAGRVDKRDIIPVIAQVTRRASGRYDGRRCSICRGIKQSLAFNTYFSLIGNDHIDPNEDVVQYASRKNITSYFNDEDDGSSSPSGGEELGEGERDDEEHNSEEETLLLESFFLPLNQNSLDKRVKLAVGFIPSGCPVKDVDGNVNVRLAYAYDTPPSRVGKGDQPFFLTSMTTLVTEKVDISHHAQASLEGKLLALKRNIQVSDGLRSYFAKITDLMHRNILSWYEDDYVIAKDMVDNAAELENDQGRSGLCTCTCSSTVTSFMALNEYESLLSSLSIQDEALVAPQARDMSRNSEDASAFARVQ